MNAALWPLLTFDGYDNQDHLMFSFCYFLQLEAGQGFKIDPDVPINQMFTEGDYQDGDFVLAAALFALHHNLDLNDNMLNYDLTLREFVAMLAKSQDLNPDEFKTALNKLIDVMKLRLRTN